MTKKIPLLERMKSGPVLGDGAMGTMLYAQGIFINRCYDELNLAQADNIENIHRDYIAAGAELIETNTFTANKILLAEHGLENKTKQINIRGAEIARAACDDLPVYVAGSIGPTHLILEKDLTETAQRVSAAFIQQAAALAEGGVDLIILETFYSLNELIIAIDAVKSEVNIPVCAQLTFDPDKQAAYDARGLTPAVVARCLADTGAEIIGTNCGAGPATLLNIVEKMADATETPVSVFANAGVPETHSGRMMTLGTSPEYLGEYARRYAQAGASLIGGCCGTNPRMISEMLRFLKGITAEHRSRVILKPASHDFAREPVPTEERSPFGKKLVDPKRDRPLISVELSPPRGVDPARAIEGARILKEGGVDIVNIPDGPRAVPRMSPITTATIVERETGMETLVHYCCRDRNLLGIQMDLLGSSALGLHNVMLITGDPPKIGNVQSASPVFDVDSIGLVRFADSLNHGVGLANADIKSQTKFVIGAGCNPGSVDSETEAVRFGQKVEAGAQFFFSQPVYTEKLLTSFLSHTEKWSSVPFFVGILPLASVRNAEFLHNEVPGMQIPDDIMARIKMCATVEKQAQEGIRIAQEMMVHALTLPRVTGVYLFPPFGRYETVLSVLEAL
jgi:methionine synthase / methylenetetrahydrofolate reductase(NADPH)